MDFSLRKWSLKMPKQQSVLSVASWRGVGEVWQSECQERELPGGFGGRWDGQRGRWSWDRKTGVNLRQTSWWTRHKAWLRFAEEAPTVTQRGRVVQSADDDTWQKPSGHFGNSNQRPSMENEILAWIEYFFLPGLFSVLFHWVIWLFVFFACTEYECL